MNGTKVIVYAEEEGGDYQVFRSETDAKTEEKFREGIERKQILFQLGDRIISIRPMFMALCEVRENFDFQLGMSREDFAKEQKEAEQKKKQKQDEE